MSAAVKAGGAYFALVFLAGFVLETVRTLILAPRLGPVAAVLVELPVILAASWLACGWTLKKFSVPSFARSRLVMGGVAFVLLIAAEFLLAAAFGRSPGAYLASFATLEGGLGLGGQILFGLFPWIRR